MTFLNQITIKTDVEKEKFFRYVESIFTWISVKFCLTQQKKHFLKWVKMTHFLSEASILLNMLSYVTHNMNWIFYSIKWAETTHYYE